MLPITLKGASSTTSKTRQIGQSQAPPSTQPPPGSFLSDKIPRIKQLEEDITKEKDCRKVIMSTFQSQFTLLYDKKFSSEMQ